LKAIPVTLIGLLIYLSSLIKQLSQGGSSDQIADRLAISFHTVESHKKNLCSKLNVNSSAELGNYAINEGLL
jgi:two-component system nitrate/nitrite response regulator NarL